MDRLARTAEDYLGGLKTLDLQDDVIVRELDRSQKEVGRAGGQYHIEFAGLSDHPIDGRWKLSNGDVFASNLDGAIELLASIFLSENQKGLSFSIAPDPDGPSRLRISFEPAHETGPQKSLSRFSAPVRGFLIADFSDLRPLSLTVNMLDLPISIRHHWFLSYKVQSVSFEINFTLQQSPAGKEVLLLPQLATSRMVTSRGTFVVEHKYTVLPRRRALK